MRMVTRLLTGAAAVATMAGGAALANPSAAQADVHAASCVNYYNVAYGCAARHEATVFDPVCDDHEVRNNVVFRNGTRANVYDPNGCGQGVGRKFFKRYIVKYRICAVGVGCSNWNLP